MKGFIEVRKLCWERGIKGGEERKALVNINHIEEVCENVIYQAFKIPGAVEQDYIVCNETYEEIVEKIKEATR